MDFATSRNLYSFYLTVWSRYIGNLLRFALGSLSPSAAFPFIMHFWDNLVMRIFHFSPILFATVREKSCSGKEVGEKVSVEEMATQSVDTA